MTTEHSAAATPSGRLAIFRWILVVPAAFAGWYVALVVAMLVYGLAQRFCPPELVVSEMCTASWHGPFFDVLVIGGASLAAALIVLLPALTAPAHRVTVARIAYAAGLACALWMVVSDSGGKWLVTPALVGACLSGAVALWAFERRARRASAKAGPSAG